MLGELGRGAFGSALKARRRADGSLVCLKALDWRSMGASERRMVGMQGGGPNIRPWAHLFAALVCSSLPSECDRFSRVWPTMLPCLTDSTCPAQTRDEVRVLRSLSHPNVIQYHACFQDGGVQYIAMEFAEVRRLAASGTSNSCCQARGESCR